MLLNTEEGDVECWDINDIVEAEFGFFWEFNIHCAYALNLACSCTVAKCDMFGLACIWRHADE